MWSNTTDYINDSPVLAVSITSILSNLELAISTSRRVYNNKLCRIYGFIILGKSSLYVLCYDLTFELNSDLTCVDFRNMCVRMAYALGYANSSIEIAFPNPKTGSKGKQKILFD